MIGVRARATPFRYEGDQVIDDCLDVEGPVALPGPHSRRPVPRAVDRDHVGQVPLTRSPRKPNSGTSDDHLPEPKSKNGEVVLHAERVLLEGHTARARLGENAVTE